MEGDTKITSVEKEKVKDPKRVEQRKRLLPFPERQKNVRQGNERSNHGKRLNNNSIQVFSIRTR